MATNTAPTVKLTRIAAGVYEYRTGPGERDRYRIERYTVAADSGGYGRTDAWTITLPGEVRPDLMVDTLADARRAVAPAEAEAAEPGSFEAEATAAGFSPVLARTLAAGQTVAVRREFLGVEHGPLLVATVVAVAALDPRWGDEIAVTLELHDGQIGDAVIEAAEIAWVR